MISKTWYPVLLLLLSSPLQAQDLLLNDFEAASYGAWTVTGTAFGPAPAHGTLPGQNPVEGFLGRGLVNSFHGGDASTGTLTSTPFTIQRCFIRFLIGGGWFQGKTCINLLVDGQVVRTAVGPGDRERLDWKQWDVAALRGQSATLQIVDRQHLGWGHINVDQILQTDTSLPAIRTDATRRITAAKRYLNLPVKNGAPRRLVEVLLDGKPVREFNLELADDQPNWWAFLDLAPFQGRQVVLRVETLPEHSHGLELIEPSDTLKATEDLYHESLRPQFHFTSRRGWLNDPNGLFFYQGEYHLGYQHNPYGWSWDNMHWGHAVSTNLVHWQELPVSHYPDQFGPVWSGSTVVDWHNSAGFGPEALVSFYTAAGSLTRMAAGKDFSQCLAYSLDRGRSWLAWSNNPVVPNVSNDNRDPKVFWYPPQRKWVMVFWLDRNDFGFFSSTNLTQWTRMSTLTMPGVIECPDLFELPVEDDPANTRWVFCAGGGRYYLGHFDGSAFTPQSEVLQMSAGDCFAVAQTFSDVPAGDGRRIMIVHGTAAFPGMPFNRIMNFPIELSLQKTDRGLRLCSNPVREIQSLWRTTQTLPVQELQPARDPLAGTQAEFLDLSVEIEPAQATKVNCVLRGFPVTYDASAARLTCLDRTAPLPLMNGRVRLRCLVDRGILEIFGNDGRLYMPMRVPPKHGPGPVGLSVEGGTARLLSLELHELNSAWK